VAGAGLLLLVHILAARLLGPDYGKYAYVCTWAVVLAMVGKLGWDSTFMRYLPRYEVAMRRDLLRGLLGFAWQSTAAWFLAICAVFLLIARRLLPLSWHDLVFCYLLAAAYIVLRIANGCLRSRKRIFRAESPERLFYTLAFGGILGSLLLLRVRVDYTAVLLADVLVLGACAVVALAWCAGLYRANLKGVTARFERGAWLNTCVPLLFMSCMQLVQNRTDILMIASLLGKTEAGVYTAATRIASVMVLGLVSINTITAPTISEALAAEDRGRLGAILSFSAAASLAFLAVCLPGLVLGSRLLLSLFGAGFTAGRAALLILVVGQGANALCGPVAIVMAISGEQWIAFVLIFLSAAANVVLNAFLIPRYGLVGAAVATCASMIFWNVAMAVYIGLRLRIDPSFFRLVPWLVSRVRRPTS